MESGELIDILNVSFSQSLTRFDTAKQQAVRRRSCQPRQQCILPADMHQGAWVLCTAEGSRRIPWWPLKFWTSWVLTDYCVLFSYLRWHNRCEGVPKSSPLHPFCLVWTLLQRSVLSMNRLCGLKRSITSNQDTPGCNRTMHMYCKRLSESHSRMHRMLLRALPCSTPDQCARK